MEPYVLEELARAMARDRREEARRGRLVTRASPPLRSPLRSRLARLLVAAAAWLDPAAARRAGPMGGHA